MNDILTSETLTKRLSKKEIFSEINHLFDSPIEEIQELSEGNVNQIFRVIMANKKTFIVKYAPPFAYRYRDIKIANARNNYETMVLKHFGSHSNHYPKIYASFPSLNMTVMEDLQNCQTLRDALIEGITFPNLANDILNIFSKYSKNTDKNDLENSQYCYKNGIEELQNITKLFVFEKPFGKDYPEGFICPDSNLDWVKLHIFKSPQIQMIRKKLQKKYYSSTEYLLHGDLHTGSILVNQENTYIIDPEFSKLGPISFDLGMLIANLIMVGIASEFHLSANPISQIKFKKWLFSMIEIIWSNIFTCISDKQNCINTLKQETIGYCGIEIIRRVIGEAQIKDFLSISNLKIRANLEMKALQVGVNQLTQCEKNIEISNYINYE